MRVQVILALVFLSQHLNHGETATLGSLETMHDSNHERLYSDRESPNVVIASTSLHNPSQVKWLSDELEEKTKEVEKKDNQATTVQQFKDSYLGPILLKRPTTLNTQPKNDLSHSNKSELLLSDLFSFKTIPPTSQRRLPTQRPQEIVLSAAPAYQPIVQQPFSQSSVLSFHEKSLKQQQQPVSTEPPALTMTHSQETPVPTSQQPIGIYTNLHYHQLYLGHNPFIEILRPFSYADDNIVTLNLSHSHIYEIDSEAFVGQRFEHIDLSNNKLGLIHSRSFRIGPSHSRHNPSPFDPLNNSSKSAVYPTRRPPPTNPKSVTIDLSHNPAIVALSGAFDHIDVPNCLLNFTNSTVELKFGAFKKYFKDHPGHIVDIESVDCCEQEWLLGYKHNFLAKTHCDHDPSLFLSKVSQQTIIDSCIAYVKLARHSMTIQGPSIIHQVAATPRTNAHSQLDNQYLTYLILGGTAMVLTSLSIYIIYYMFSLKAAFVYQMQNKI